MPRSYAWYTMIKTEELITVREVGFPLFLYFKSTWRFGTSPRLACEKKRGGVFYRREARHAHVLRDNSMMNRHPL